MEITSWPKTLHSQLTGSTEIQTHDLHIQSPMHYPFSHHTHIHTHAHTHAHIYIYIYMKYINHNLTDGNVGCSTRLIKTEEET